jgi:hypothetical protein
MPVTATLRVALATLLIAALAALPAGGAGANGGPCAVPRGYFVLKKTHRAVVMVRERGSQRVYGCLFKVDRRVRLADFSPRYPLAGRYVAYREVSEDPVAGTHYDVFVVNLRTGRARRTHPAFTTPTADDGTVNSTITDIVLKRNGSVAWISCPTRDGNEEFCFRNGPFQVWRLDRRYAKKLDSSAEVRRRSLRREGSRISWQHGAASRSASLR